MITERDIKQIALLEIQRLSGMDGDALQAVSHAVASMVWKDLERDLKVIKDAYETVRKNPDGTSVTTHARYNLEGALADLESGNNDGTTRNTIRRVINQLAVIERALK